MFRIANNYDSANGTPPCRRHPPRSHVIGAVHWKQVAYISIVLLLVGLQCRAQAFAREPVLINLMKTEARALEQLIKTAPGLTAHTRLSQSAAALSAMIAPLESDAQARQQIHQISERLGTLVGAAAPVTAAEAQPDLMAFNQKIGAIRMLTAQLSVPPKKGYTNTTHITYVLLGSLILILFLTGLTMWSRHRIFDEAQDKDRIAEIAMKQTFGFPVGTVRGIMALSVTLLFAIALFLGKESMENIPEVLKIIVSLVFGFYFAKSTDPTKDIMDAMQSRDRQNAATRREADDHARGKTMETYQTLAEDSQKRMDQLTRLNIDHRAVKEMHTASKTLYDRGNLQEAVQTLEQTRSMADLLLGEYDQARHIYEKTLTREQRQKLDEARVAIDKADMDISGADLISGFIAAMGSLKEKGAHLVPLFKKRVAGEAFSPRDLMGLVSHLKAAGDHKSLDNMVDLAVNKIGDKGAGPLRELLKQHLEAVMTADDHGLDQLFSSTLSASGAQKKTFLELVTKIRKNLVDRFLGDAIKTGLPTSLPFEAFKHAVKTVRSDTGENRGTAALKTALDLGETLLAEMPEETVAKTAGAVARGLFKLFGASDKDAPKR